MNNPATKANDLYPRPESHGKEQHSDQNDRKNGIPHLTSAVLRALCG